MALRTLEEFKVKHYSDAVRPNLFYVIVNFPQSVVSGSSDLPEMSKWLVQSASLPGRSIGVIEIGFRGHKLKYAGNTVFSDWSATFLQDPQFKLRNAFELWMEYMDSVPVGIRGVDITYKSTIEIVQEDGRQNIIKKVICVGAFPNDVADVALGQDENDTAEMFDCGISYDYYLTSLNI